MENKVATIISYLVHPLIMPVVGLLIITHSGTYAGDLDISLRNFIYLYVFIFTFMIPVALIPLYFYLKIIKDTQLSEKRDRIIPYYITLFFYVLAYIFIRRIPVSTVYGHFLFAASISVLLVLIISYFWKISAHLVGLGGLAGLILSLSLHFGPDLLLFLIIILFVSGIAGYARLKLNAHTPLQVYTGFLIGFITMMMVFSF